MFCWVPGHAGVEGNEIADCSAKSSLNKSETDINISLGRVQLKEKNKHSIEREWQRLWENETKVRHYYSLQSQVKEARHCYGSRRDSVQICRLRVESVFICYWKAS